MKRKNKKSNIIKLGSETEAENGVYHLLKDGGRGKYAVWVQPYDKYQGRRIRSYTNWHRLKNGSLGECRRAIADAVSQKDAPVKNTIKKSKSKNMVRGRKK